MLNRECVSLVLSSPDEVHRDELDEGGNRDVELHEQEEVEEARLVAKTERLNDALVTERECKAGKHYQKRGARHENLLQDVTVYDVSELMVHNGTDLCD